MLIKFLSSYLSDIQLFISIFNYFGLKTKKRESWVQSCRVLCQNCFAKFAAYSKGFSVLLSYTNLREYFMAPWVKILLYNQKIVCLNCNVHLVRFRDTTQQKAASDLWVKNHKNAVISIGWVRLSFNNSPTGGNTEIFGRVWQ